MPLDAFCTMIPQQIVTALRSPELIKIYLNDGKNKQTILLQETIENISFPAQLPVDAEQDSQNLATTGIIILPLSGGGRGPVINEGEVVSPGLLVSLLTDAISEAQLRPELNARLNNIPLTIPNRRSQEGYAAHNDVVILDRDWAGRLPRIALDVFGGTLQHRVETIVGGITYVEFPPQEIFYGHSGFTNGDRFTVKAAILEKVAPVVVNLNWTPAPVVGPPVTALTVNSVVTNTTLTCMGLRIQGLLSLARTAAYAVAGTMQAQILVDGGSWVTFAEIHWDFAATGNGTCSEKFDVMLAYDQAQHSYQFRGRMVVDSDEEINRQLTGSIQIFTVTEIGSGSVLSNDLLLKWACKD